MKKRILALLLTGAMVFGLAACSSGSGEASPAGTGSGETAPAETESAQTVKVGMVCIGDENDQGYTYNIMRGVSEATEMLAEKGINVEWVTKYNVPENAECEDANIELADEGCEIIINSSFGFEDFMLKVAADYPDITFISLTNLQSSTSELENVHNAFADIYEGRYLSGVVGGMKLQEMIDNGEITPEQAVIGYVGAFPYAEVISGYTAFYLGAKSVCPSVTMKVKYVNSWSAPTDEANAAQALCDEGCLLISQHSDNTTPATAAQSAGAFSCGYNNDMISVAPEASLISTRIDWGVYFTYAIETLVNGEELPKDWTAGMAEGAVVMTELNEDIAAAGTAEKLAEVEAGIIDGSIHPFAGPWTGVSSTGDTLEMAEGEWFEESDVDGGKTSAPYFTWIIEGITEE